MAARYLKSEGFEPVLFEQGEFIGGQWGGDPQQSGVWPGMRTNSSRIMTSFSDLPLGAGLPIYPAGHAIGEYLLRYAELFDLMPHVRLKTPVRELRRDAKHGWILRTDASEERYERVVLAVGRYGNPTIPDVPGLRSFAGSGGVNHTFSYKRPEYYRGLRVLVAGSSISSLEIACDLAMLGAARVAVACRKQRYVLPKFIRGVPTDQMAYTRFAALASDSSPSPDGSPTWKQFILDAVGNPEQYGAPRPADNLAEAGVAPSQYFLPFVAEGRITVKPWIECVDNQVVRFSDGSFETFDAILFGTGYHLQFPFLSAELCHTLNAHSQHLDLYKSTFHPELAGLAFLGLFKSIGPTFPVLELQARWISYIFSGARAAPSKDELNAGIAAYRENSASRQRDLPYHAAALLFAQAAGVEPELERWPDLARQLMFGPLTPVSFRMSGRDSLADAPQRFASEIEASGCMPSTELTPLQRKQLRALARARGDKAFSRYVAAICPRKPLSGSTKIPAQAAMERI